jgi:L-ribulokinase
MREASATPDQIVGIGVDFTSCTMLPALADGTPMCLVDRFKSVPLAWPKLWKHHGAKHEVDRINHVARERQEPWLARYGGTIGIEWFFPKSSKPFITAPLVYDATEVWLEGGDWFVWQLTTGPFPRCKPTELARSHLPGRLQSLLEQAHGFPSRDYFAAVDPRFADVVSSKCPARSEAPALQAGTLTQASGRPLRSAPRHPRQRRHHRRPRRRPRRRVRGAVHHGHGHGHQLPVT